MRGGLHAVSSGVEFCVATCQDQVGCIDLTWFKKVAPTDSSAGDQNSANHLTSASAQSVGEERKASGASEEQTSSNASGERIE